MRNPYLFLAILLTIVLGYGILSLKMPASPSVKIDSDFLSKTFPQLKGARISQVADLKEIFREPFRANRYTFVLKGDFNRDGYTDYFISGQFEESGKMKPFFTLLAIKGSRVDIEILNTEVSDTLMLKREKENIIAAYALNSNDFYIIYWDGKTYQTKYAGNPETLE